MRPCSSFLISDVKTCVLRRQARTVETLSSGVLAIPYPGVYHTRACTAESLSSGVLFPRQLRQAWHRVDVLTSVAVLVVVSSRLLSSPIHVGITVLVVVAFFAFVEIGALDAVIVVTVRPGLRSTLFSKFAVLRQSCGIKPDLERRWEGIGRGAARRLESKTTGTPELSASLADDLATVPLMRSDGSGALAQPLKTIASGVPATVPSLCS